MKCNYGESLEEMLRYQLVVEVFREDIRRRLLSDHKLTLQRAIEIISIEKQVDKDSYLFHKLHDRMNVAQSIEHVQNDEKSPKQGRKTRDKIKRKCYKCGGFHSDQRSCNTNCFFLGGSKLKCNFCHEMGHIAKICCAKKKLATKTQQATETKSVINEVPYLQFLENPSNTKYKQDMEEPVHLINYIF